MAEGDAARSRPDLNAAIRSAGAALVAVMLIGGPALADDGRPMRLVNVPTAQAAGHPDEPGVLDRIARWLDRSVGDVGEGLKDALGDVEQFSDRTRNAVKDAARDASKSAGSLATLPDVRIVPERAICPSAANGAPDCRRAAQAVCRRHGFASGTSLEIRSEEKCSLRARLARRAGQPDTCRNETYVLRSMCR